MCVAKPVDDERYTIITRFRLGNSRVSWLKTNRGTNVGINMEINEHGNVKLIGTHYRKQDIKLVSNALLQGVPVS